LEIVLPTTWSIPQSMRFSKRASTGSIGDGKIFLSKVKNPSVSGTGERGQ